LRGRHGGDERKAKRFKSMQEESEPWLQLMDDLKRHLDEVVDRKWLVPDVREALLR